MAETPHDVSGTVQIITAIIGSAGGFILAIKALFTRAEPEAFRMSASRDLERRFDKFDQNISKLDELVGTVRALTGRIAEEASARGNVGERVAVLETAVQDIQKAVEDIKDQAHTIKHSATNIESGVKSIPEATARRLAQESNINGATHL